MPKTLQAASCIFLMTLLTFNNKGIYCAKADVYIDPWKPVKNALITHAHSDHARVGMGRYLAHVLTVPVLKHRLGPDIDVQGVQYAEPIKINGVEFSLHPAGHIPGSAQIRVAYRGEVWVVSGDYKLEADGFSEAYQPIKCHHFITESTFGLPVYTWLPQHTVFQSINNWWQKNKEENKVSVIAGYSLGKAQRILRGLDNSFGKIYTHGAIENTNQVLRNCGLDLPETHFISDDTTKKELEGQVVICPPSAIGTPWMRRLGQYSTGFCSGWMALRGARRRRAADRGFVLSDHADWQGLLMAVENSEADHVYVTHGYKEIFARFLREEKGLNATTVDTLYEEGVSEE